MLSFYFKKEEITNIGPLLAQLYLLHWKKEEITKVRVKKLRLFEIWMRDPNMHIVISRVLISSRPRSRLLHRVVSNIVSGYREENEIGNLFDS